MRAGLSTSLLAMALWACPGPQSGVDGGGPGDAGAPRMVSGRRVTLRFTETEVLRTPVDLSSADVAALVLEPSGDFTTYPGFGHADGVWAVHDVPAGPYYLKVDQAYVVTSAEHVELDDYLQGRPEAPRADAGTLLSLNLTNLSPWQQGKETMMIFSTNTGAMAWSFEGAVTPRIPDAGTTLVGTVPYTRLSPAALLDASQSDTLWVTQLMAMTSDAGVGYLSVLRSFQSGPLTVADNQTTTVSGAFRTVPDTLSRHVLWKRSAIAAMQGRVGAGVTPTAPWYVTIMAGKFGVGTGLPTHVMNFIGSPDTTDLDLGGLSFGNPYLADWTMNVRLSGLWQASLALPGRKAAGQFVFYREYADLSLLDNGVAAPSYGPVQSLRLNGSDATVALNGVGTTPLLSWGPPLEGDAKGYLVTVLSLAPDATDAGTRLATAGTITTRQTSVKLPPGLLHGGGTYAVIVAALVGKDLDFETKPWARPMPYTSAEAVSGIFTP